MPRKRKYARTKKGGYYKRKKQERNKMVRYTAIPTSIFAAPGGVTRNKHRFRYVSTPQITAGAGLVGEYVFRMNGCDDPNFTSTGHQPMNWDVYKQFWRRYCVLGAKARVTLVNQDTTTEHVCMLTNTSLGSFTFTDANNYAENSDKQIVMTQKGSSRNVVTMNSYFSARKWFNTADPSADDTIGALVSGNPNRGCFLFINAYEIKGLAVALSAHVVIDYWVQFNEPEEGIAS